MEVIALLSVLGSNLCVLALGWAIYAGMGYLLFAKSLKACPFLIRLNLYPLLGWAFLVTFAYYLRVLATALFNLWTVVLWSACCLA